MVIGVVLGLLVGAVLGLTGAGGGILAVPALMFGLGMSMPRAVPIALISVGMGAALGAVQGLRLGMVRYKAALLMAAAGGLASPLGVAIAHRLPKDGLSALFAAIMLWVAYQLFMQSRAFSAAVDQAEPAKPCKVSPETGRFLWTVRTAATLASIGAVSGIGTGMLGVGGGFIIVPALARYTALRMRSIVSTSLTIVSLISASTVAAALIQGLTVSPEEWGFIGGVMGGMMAGRYLGNHLTEVVLKRSFGSICIVVAVLMLARSLT